MAEPDLPPAIQRFVAEVDEYVLNVERATRATRELAVEAAKTAAIVKAEFGKVGRAAAELAGEFQLLSEEMGAVSRAAGETTGAEDVLKGATGDLDRATAGLAGVAGRAADGLRGEGAASSETAALIAALETRVNDLSDALARNTVAAATDRAAIEAVGRANLGAAAATTAAAAGANRAAVGFRAFGFGLRLTRAAIHWIITGTAEFLAVAIPAVIAFAAGMAVAAQGAVNVASHLQSVYTATEATAAAFHTTAGDVLGMGHALQAAQDAANPGVYELLGSAVNDVKSHFADFASTGLNVVHMLDQFSARITMDLRGSVGGQLHSLLDGMTTDLQQFGQVFGNLGHALLNIASIMPGIAHNMLLPLLAGLTGLLRIVTALPAPILTMTMVLEEFFRWGGVVAQMMVRLTGQWGLFQALLPEGAGFILRFGTAIKTLGVAAGQQMLNLGAFASRLKITGAAGEKAGTAIGNAGIKIGSAFESLTPAMITWSLLGVAAVVAVGIALDHVRNKSQQLIDTTNQMVANATTSAGAFKDLAGGIAAANVGIIQQTQALHSYNGVQQFMGQIIARQVSALGFLGPAIGGAAQGALNFATKNKLLSEGLLAAIPIAGQAAAVWLHFGGGAGEAASQVNALTAAQRKWVSQGRDILSNAQTLANIFHTSLPAAMSLADQAGVKLNASWKGNSFAIAQAITQIHNLEQGWTSMGAPASQLGNDITVVGIQSQLAATKVQQLNQAWDQWIQSVTSGTSTMSQLQTSLNGMNHAALYTSASVTGAIHSITTATGKSAYTLRGFGAAAMQSWQQFNSAITTGNSAIDTLQLGLTEGVVHGKQFTSTVKAMVGEMLPFTQGNRAAVTALDNLAKRAGGPTTTSLKTLAAWSGIHGKAAMEAFVKSMQRVQTQMGSMGKVAQNLSAIVQSQVQASMAAAIEKSTKLDYWVTKLATDMAAQHPNAQQIATDQGHVQSSYDRTISLLNDQAKKYDQVRQAQLRQAAASDRAATAAHNHAARLREATTGLGLFGGKLSEVSGTAPASLGKIHTAVTQHLGTLPGLLKKTGDAAVTALAGAVTKGTPKVHTAASAMKQSAVTATSKLPALLHQVGVAASQGLAGGLLAREPAVIAAATRIANATTNAMRVSLKTQSPSRVTWLIGQNTVQGLINGLTQGIPQIQKAIGELVATVREAFRKGVISMGRESDLVTWVRSDNTRLQGLARQRSAIANEIKQVNATTAALQTSFGSIIHPFSGTGPTPLTAKQLAAIPTAQQDVAGLRSQLSVMKKFASDLTRLKKLGLAPGLIAKIIAMGPVQGSAYAEALIAAAGQGAAGAPNPGGPDGGPMLPGGVNPGGKLGGPPTNAGGGATGIIAQLNSAWNQINAMSKSLADQVSGSLYGAGQQGAAGLIAGLKSQMKHIDAMMKHIADVLVRRLKKDLKIKSPSEVMHGHGLAIDEGLAKGIYDGAPMVDAAMRHLGGVVAGGLPKWVNPGGGARGGDGVTGIDPGGLMRLVGSLTGPGGPLGAGGIHFGAASPEPFRGPHGGASPGGLWVPPPGHGGGVNPGGPASLIVHVHVHGNVMTSQELGAEVRKEINRYSRRNWSTGLAPHGKVS